MICLARHASSACKYIDVVEIDECRRLSPNRSELGASVQRVCRVRVPHPVRRLVQTHRPIDRLGDDKALRVAFTVRGKRAETVLATGCPLEVDVRSFPPGHCAQSVFGRTAALYYRHQATPAFTVMVARSLAADVWHGLCVAASTDGYEVGLPAAFDAARARLPRRSRAAGG